MPILSQNAKRAQILIRAHKQRFLQREPLLTAESLRVAEIRKQILKDPLIQPKNRRKLLTQLDQILVRHSDAALQLLEERKKQN
ncbi:MAG: hypothetical protein WCW13_05550 [archaeon]|jgi:hypothetical protein